jgi:hypothetical protein
MKKDEELSIKDIVHLTAAEEEGKHHRKSVASWLWVDTSDYVAHVADVDTKKMSTYK